MKRNVSSNNAAIEKNDTAMAITQPSEYKIGHTTYIVVTKFNTCGESLNDVLARLITKDIQKIA